MKKVKTMLTAFAVFASLLMLMTPTMARPIQEKITRDSTQIFKNDPDSELLTLIDKIENDEELSLIASLIEQTDNIDEKFALSAEYADSLKNDPCFADLQELVGLNYSQELDKIIDEVMDFAAELAGSNTVETQEEYILCGAIQLPDSFSLGESSTDNSGPANTICNTDVSIISQSDSEGYTPNNGPVSGQSEEFDDIVSYGEQDECLPYWPGFMHNMNGEIYIPGLGWVAESEYGWLEDLLRDIWNFIVGAIATLVDIVTIAVLLTTAGIGALTWLVTGTVVGGSALWIFYAIQDLFDGENNQATILGEIVWCLLNYDNLVGGFVDGFNFSWDVLMWLVDQVIGEEDGSF